MTGAIFFNAEFSAPWGFAAPPAQRVAPVLAPGTERLVQYHLVTEGSAVVGLEGAADMSVAAGDIVIFPHGDAHTVRNGSPSRIMDGQPRRSAGSVRAICRQRGSVAGEKPPSSCAGFSAAIGRRSGCFLPVSRS